MLCVYFLLRIISFIRSEKSDIIASIVYLHLHVLSSENMASTTVVNLDTDSDDDDHKHPIDCYPQL